CELLVTKHAQSVARCLALRFGGLDIRERQEMGSPGVEAVVAAAPRALAEELQIATTVIYEHVVLSRNTEHVVGPDRPYDLLDRVEFVRTTEVDVIAGVHDERRPLR